MKNDIVKRLERILDALGVPKAEIKLDFPENPEHGDFTTNAALIYAKKLAMAPRALADKIVVEFKKSLPAEVKDASVAGPGFINFSVKDDIVAQQVISSETFDRKHVGSASSEKVMVEYTDPNPFKVFHIGHLMSNAIGESVSRLIESSGTDVKRANWQGDVGPHVAKAVWGAQRLEKTKSDGADFWGKAYAFGAEAYDTQPGSKSQIDGINKKIYDRSDPAINALYDKGRAESLAAFEALYKRLGTEFDHYFFEGKEGRNGEVIVKAHLADEVFEKSEGAIVFKGEKYGLHTRVFITSQGLPTYEAKELGLNAEKFKLYPDLDRSIIVTANEQSDYFKVLLKVFSLIDTNIFEKTRHLSHGMMRFASGKMSSRKGNVVSAESLIADIKEMVAKKIAGRGFSAEEADEISDTVAIGAIKYTILRSSIGGDIVFDSAASISFEGDSGPYLQYSAVRAASVLEKAAKQADTYRKQLTLPGKVGLLEKLLMRFPEVVKRARREHAPQIVANYLITLAGAFNSFYASQTIIDEQDLLSPYRIAVTQTFQKVMTDGLWLLGIKVPKKM